MRILSWLIIAAPLVLGAAAPRPVSTPLVLGFGVREGSIPHHPALQSVDTEGPCGAVALLRVDRIPDFATSEPLMTVPAVELDGRGKAVRRWRLPADHVVSAVEGDWLLVSYAGKSGPFWVDTAGRLGVATAEDAAFATGGEDGVSVVDACPASTEMPEGAQCLSVRDRAARTRRIIAAPGVCS